MEIERRDFFAAAALAALISREGSGTTKEVAANAAYRYADAMIAKADETKK